MDATSTVQMGVPKCERKSLEFWWSWLQALGSTQGAQQTSGNSPRHVEDVSPFHEYARETMVRTKQGIDANSASSRKCSDTGPLRPRRFGQPSRLREGNRFF